MKHLTYCTSLILLSLTLFSCDGRRVRGNGHVTTETRRLGSYHNISLHAAVDVYLTQGPETAVVIEGEANILPYIIIEEDGGTLSIKQQDNTSYSSFHPIKVKLTAPNITALNVTGSGTINLVNTIDNEESITLSITGSGNIKGNIHTPDVKADVAGSGDIIISGETKNLEFEGNGSGDFKGKSLKAENATISISGSGDVEVNASVKLDANTTGSGDVNYYGNPNVTSNKTGSGSVRKKD
jgi:carbon monoxide dehydrogenase subunit G